MKKNKENGGTIATHDINLAQTNNETSLHSFISF